MRLSFFKNRCLFHKLVDQKQKKMLVKFQSTITSQIWMLVFGIFEPIDGYQVYDPHCSMGTNKEHISAIKNPLFILYFPIYF